MLGVSKGVFRGRLALARLIDVKGERSATIRRACVRKLHEVICRISHCERRTASVPIIVDADTWISTEKFSPLLTASQPQAEQQGKCQAESQHHHPSHPLAHQHTLARSRPHSHDHSIVQPRPFHSSSSSMSRFISKRTSSHKHSDSSSALSQPPRPTIRRQFQSRRLSI